VWLLFRKCGIIDFSQSDKSLRHGTEIALFLQLSFKVQLGLNGATYKGLIEMQKRCFHMDRLCGLSEFLAADPEVRVRFPARFSEK
jgi:hypothetical protein